MRAVDYHRKRKDQSYPYRLGSNGVHIDDGEVRVGWSLDEHSNRVNFTHTVSWEKYQFSYHSLVIGRYLTCDLQVPEVQFISKNAHIDNCF